MRPLEIEQYKCQNVSSHELEVYPCLVKEFYFREIGWISFKGVKIENILKIAYGKELNVLQTDFYTYYLDGGLGELKYWTILDTPQCAKIELKDSKVCPVILLRLTSDGNNASLFYIPIALLCTWSTDPDSKCYDEEYSPRFVTFGLGSFNWRERPFSGLYEKLKEMKKIAIVTTPNEPSIYNSSTHIDYMCFYK